jgi:ankyrin repeat protein
LQDGETPLFFAVIHRYDKIVDVLVEANADVNAADKVRHFSIFASNLRSVLCDFE